ncbi:hypothetical protein Tco_0578685, partial [Tanacetum coccineum]
PAAREAVEKDEEDDEGDKAAGGGAGHEEAGGSVDMYRNMSQQDERAHWMYDHTVRQFQYPSTRDNLDPHLQINSFPSYETDYPRVGYQGYMPPGYEYCLGPSQDDS